VPCPASERAPAPAEGTKSGFWRVKIRRPDHLSNPKNFIPLGKTGCDIIYSRVSTTAQGATVEDSLNDDINLETEEVVKFLDDDELIKSVRKIRLRRPSGKFPLLSIGDHASSSTVESQPPKLDENPMKFRSLSIETAPHTQYSRVDGQPYTKTQQKSDLKRAIKEKISQKLESAGENNTKPRIPRQVALKGQKITTITTEKGTYSTPTKNIIVGIHGKRFDVAIQNSKLVFKH
jgi:hypothetical protein